MPQEGDLHTAFEVRAGEGKKRGRDGSASRKQGQQQAS